MHQEEIVKVDDKTYKPDLVVYGQKRITVIDTQIVNDQ